MAKYIKKEKLAIKDGRLVKKNKVVALFNYSIVRQYNELEMLLQKAMYLNEQPDYQPAPTLKGFEFESGFERSRFKVEKPETPLTDKKFEEAMGFIKELKDCKRADDIDIIIERFADLLEFCEADEALVDECGCADRFDGKYLGDPLELDVDRVKSAIALVANTEAFVCVDHDLTGRSAKPCVVDDMEEADED